MAINFNNIPTTTRTPAVYVEVDNSRALKGLAANPHKALIIGQKTTDSNAGAKLGNALTETLYSISSDGLADGFFGVGSQLARMCNIFKKNNPNTDLYAIALSASAGAVQASAAVNFSTIFSHNGDSASTANESLRMYVNGKKAEILITSGWSGVDVASRFLTYISEANDFPVLVSLVAASARLVLSALNSGLAGNYLDVRFNYNDGDSYPTCMDSNVPLVSNFEGGTLSPNFDNAWAIIDNEQYQYIIHPYYDATNLTSIETELENRFDPLEDLQGMGFTSYRGTLALNTTLGNGRNSPHNSIMGVYDSPTDPAEIAAAYGAIAAKYLNDDPARPLHYLEMKNVLPPPVDSRFTQSERDTLLYDGIATYRVDANGKMVIDRAITTYQTNNTGTPDASYLDVTTLATISEIRYQFKTRMLNRYITTRMKLASNSFPVQPGTNVVTPNTVKGGIIALFTELRDAGLIENLDDFVENLIVERDETDVSRLNILLPPDIMNGLMVLAAKLQFIL